MVQNSERLFNNVNLNPSTLKTFLVLARDPGRRFYIREISRLTGLSVGGSHRALHTLHDMGLADMETHGRNLYFRIRMDNPAISHLKIFFNIQDMSGLLESLKKKSRKVVLFGSCARGDDTIRSDIDLFVLSESTRPLRRKLKKAMIANRRIDPVVMRAREFVSLKRSDPALFREINKGIMLWREPDGT
jgi:predicted nucleotidyltransferase